MKTEEGTHFALQASFFFLSPTATRSANHMESPESTFHSTVHLLVSSKNILCWNLQHWSPTVAQPGSRYLPNTSRHFPGTEHLPENSSSSTLSRGGLWDWKALGTEQTIFSDNLASPAEGSLFRPT